MGATKTTRPYPKVPRLSKEEVSLRIVEHFDNLQKRSKQLQECIPTARKILEELEFDNDLIATLLSFLPKLLELPICIYTFGKLFAEQSHFFYEDWDEEDPESILDEIIPMQYCRCDWPVLSRGIFAEGNLINLDWE